MSTYWTADYVLLFLGIVLLAAVITATVALGFCKRQIDAMELRVMSVEAEALQTAVEQGSPVSVTYIKTGKN